MDPRSASHLSVTTLLLSAFLFLVPQPVAGIEIISNATDTLKLEVSKGRLVRLDSPATTVFVANPAIADIQVKSPTLIYVMALKPGDTTLFAVDEQEQVLANFTVNVTHNLTRLEAAIRDLAPDSDISVASVEGAIVLDGIVSNASMVSDLKNLTRKFSPAKGAVINRLKVEASGQINLRVRVAEISRGVDKQLGFNWSLIGNLGGLAIGLASANPFAATLQQSLSLAGNVQSFNINAVVDALEQEGLVSVLAEPNLTATSGETASFLAGGEFPILVPDSNGSVTVSFKKFGVSLAFTPTLIGKSRISLHVRPEVSQLSTANAVTLGNFSVPALTTRRAETTVELGGGQSFAIAGLLQNNVTHDVSKFPGLGDIPVLGALFKSDRFQRNESELVIIVTPYIVKPVSQRVAAPNDGYVPGHDLERLVIGGANHREKETGKNPTLPGGVRRLIGPAGLQVE